MNDVSIPPPPCLEWILAFKGRAETGYDIYDAWVSPDDDLTQIWADRELQRPHHYRNNAVFNKWSQLPITEVCPPFLYFVKTWQG